MYPLVRGDVPIVGLVAVASIVPVGNQRLDLPDRSLGLLLQDCWRDHDNSKRGKPSDAMDQPSTVLNLRYRAAVFEGTCAHAAQPLFWEPNKDKDGQDDEVPRLDTTTVDKTDPRAVWMPQQLRFIVMCYTKDAATDRMKTAPHSLGQCSPSVQRQQMSGKSPEHLHICSSEAKGIPNRSCVPASARGFMRAARAARRCLQ